VLHREGIGGLATVTISGLDAAGRRDADKAGLETAPVSLQQLVVRSTTTGEDFS
jgi:ABC-2 type transport system ATP-binding protein